MFKGNSLLGKRLGEMLPQRIVFTKEMKKDYTILIPDMLPIHFEFIRACLKKRGYNAILLHNTGKNVIETGLKYVHNDSCYPAILVIGQFIDALKSGEYNIKKTALMITQTGGGCRASNYIYLLRKALKKAGLEKIPVISLNLSGLEKNSGFSLTLPLLKDMIFCVLYGDCLMNLKNQVIPYEINSGESEECSKKWIKTISDQFKYSKNISYKIFKSTVEKIATDFSNIKINTTKKIKVGIVGEIYIKYSPLGNNNLEKFLNSQDCEICVPGVLGFIMFKVDNRIDDSLLYGGGKIKFIFSKIIMSYLLNLEKVYINTIKKFPNFHVVTPYKEIRSLVKEVIGYGNKMGEGWLLTAEMIELIKTGYRNIVCSQPFGCLPNHVCGKGMIRKIKSLYKDSNIVTIDYDAGASKVNQENRIRLMLSIARERLEEEILGQ